MDIKSCIEILSTRNETTRKYHSQNECPCSAESVYQSSANVSADSICVDDEFKGAIAVYGDLELANLFTVLQGERVKVNTL